MMSGGDGGERFMYGISHFALFYCAVSKHGKVF